MLSTFWYAKKVCSCMQGLENEVLKHNFSTVKLCRTMIILVCIDLRILFSIFMLKNIHCSIIRKHACLFLFLYLECLPYINLIS